MIKQLQTMTLYLWTNSQQSRILRIPVCNVNDSVSSGDNGRRANTVSTTIDSDDDDNISSEIPEARTGQYP